MPDGLGKFRWGTGGGQVGATGGQLGGDGRVCVWRGGFRFGFSVRLFGSTLPTCLFHENPNAQMSGHLCIKVFAIERILLSKGFLKMARAAVLKSPLGNHGKIDLTPSQIHFLHQDLDFITELIGFLFPLADDGVIFFI